MPVWHKTVKEFRKKGELELLGITQEQHPDRCRLFAQWQQFDWPILHDPINLLKLRAVPVAIAIDEHGIVRDTRPRPNTIEAFVTRKFDVPEKVPPTIETVAPNLAELVARARREKSLQALRELGDATILWGGPPELDKAVSAYQTAVEMSPDDPAIHFRLGVAHRMRYESKSRKHDDFRRAVEEWDKALELNPNQYIYRRRIQQFGPRLIKPYPFYDWVERAFAEIKARDETPIQLTVKPSGAEIASPAKQLLPTSATEKSPDPNGRINRDTQQLIQINSVVVPSRIKRDGAGRIHLSLRPANKSHWNNESEPLKVWIEPPDGWTIDQQLFEAAQPNQAESRDERNIEFEVRAPRDAGNVVKFKGYALYYVCEDTEGTCLYLRQDFTFDVKLKD